ncbi:hypothetical protein CJF32_00010810 [Rutstroemia sp. NJR-2017a WRK4]|nr:hypothetical protein CJF32_00010810 [Rutstroemia sp. NJR-2017a WRK4]
MSSFSTLMCSFADDLGNLSGVAEILAKGLANVQEPISDLPSEYEILRERYYQEFLSIVNKEVAEI